jgi:hypothetical protein
VWRKDETPQHAGPPQGLPCAAQVPSDQGVPFNEKPEMQSAKITQLGIDALKSGKYNEVHMLGSCATCRACLHTSQVLFSIRALFRLLRVVFSGLYEAGMGT